MGFCNSCKHMASTWTFAGVVNRCKLTGHETTPAKKCDKWESKVESVEVKICDLCGIKLEEWCYIGYTNEGQPIMATTCTHRTCTRWLKEKRKMRVK